jgi:hypothetical protein
VQEFSSVLNWTTSRRNVTFALIKEAEKDYGFLSSFLTVHGLPAASPIVASFPRQCPRLISLDSTARSWAHRLAALPRFCIFAFFFLISHHLKKKKNLAPSPVLPCPENFAKISAYSLTAAAPSAPSSPA